MVKEQIFQDFDKVFEDSFVKDYSAKIKEEDRQQYLEKLYRKIVKDFPEIKKEEVRVKYSPSLFNIIGITMINTISYILERRIIKDPCIKVGNNFFYLGVEEQKSVIAHELGHYMDYKDKNLANIEYSLKFDRKLEDWVNGCVYFGRRKIERLRDFHERGQISADTWAVQRGYTEGLLKFLEPYCKSGHKQAIKRVANIRSYKIQEAPSPGFY